MTWARGRQERYGSGSGTRALSKAELAPWLDSRRQAQAVGVVPSQAAPETPTAAKTLTTFSIPGTAMPVLHRLDQGLMRDL